MRGVVTVVVSFPVDFKTAFIQSNRTVLVFWMLSFFHYIQNKQTILSIPFSDDNMVSRFVLDVCRLFFKVNRKFLASNSLLHLFVRLLPQDALNSFVFPSLSRLNNFKVNTKTRNFSCSVIFFYPSKEHVNLTITLIIHV